MTEITIEHIKYSTTYDSYYNETLNYWITSRCKNCIENTEIRKKSIIKDIYNKDILPCTQSCSTRPDKPLYTYEERLEETQDTINKRD